MTLGAHLFFALFVAIAVYAQNLTGFALSLILLGLVGLSGIVPLPDAVNAVSVLTAMNATIFLWRRRPVRIEPAIRPAVVASVIGSFIGMGILALLTTHAFDWLRTLLGLCILGCAFLLWRAAEPYARTSPPRVFAGVGLASGILGGLFSAAGPPLVYATYRQPWPIERIQESLIFCFAVMSILRIVVMGASGQFGMHSVSLALEAIPVVLLVTMLTGHRKPPVSREALKRIVCVLLFCAGVGMLV